MRKENVTISNEIFYLFLWEKIARRLHLDVLLSVSFCITCQSSKRSHLGRNQEFMLSMVISFKMFYLNKKIEFLSESDVACGVWSSPSMVLLTSDNEHLQLDVYHSRTLISRSMVLTVREGRSHVRLYSPVFMAHILDRRNERERI